MTHYRAKFMAAVLASLASAVFTSCSYLPKAESSVSADGSEVKSTAVIRTARPERPLE